MRFFDGRYAMVFGSRTGYCGESGTFSLSNGTLSLRPDARAGRGQCVQAASRTENLAWNDDGIVFQVALAGGAEPVLHRRARHVPKVFATVESHDGNWAGDATLPGTTAIEKADGFCERSLARPDGQSYKAMLTDGTTRTGSPAVEWILKPDTTYFQADGVLNVFRTDRMALSRTTTNHPVLNNMNVSYYWSGLSFEFGASSSNCNQWTSASDTVVGVLADASQEVFTFTSSVVTGCARQDNGLICISQ